LEREKEKEPGGRCLDEEREEKRERARRKRGQGRREGKEEENSVLVHGEGKERELEKHLKLYAFSSFKTIKHSFLGSSTLSDRQNAEW
jgi:hypothetical protein